MLAKIGVLEMDGKRGLLFEALVEESVPGGIVLPGNGSLGVVVMDTEKNLLVTKEAEEMLRTMFRNMIRTQDAIGDFDFFESRGGQKNFAWLGPVKRAWLPENAWEGARDTKWFDGAYVVEEHPPTIL